MILDLMKYFAEMDKKKLRYEFEAFSMGAEISIGENSYKIDQVLQLSENINGVENDVIKDINSKNLSAEELKNYLKYQEFFSATYSEYCGEIFQRQEYKLADYFMKFHKMFITAADIVSKQQLELKKPSNKLGRLPMSNNANNNNNTQNPTSTETMPPEMKQMRERIKELEALVEDLKEKLRVSQEPANVQNAQGNVGYKPQFLR